MEHNVQPVQTEAIDSQMTLALAHRYLAILSQHTLGEIFKEAPALSGLFLAGAPVDIDGAVHRVMAVGMETRAWRDGRCPSRPANCPRSMSADKRFCRMCEIHRTTVLCDGVHQAVPRHTCRNVKALQAMKRNRSDGRHCKRERRRRFAAQALGQVLAERRGHRDAAPVIA